MENVKWIKICTDIFDDEKMVLIESMPEADGIIVCWFKLLCMAGKQNNSGVFMFNKIAYTDKMLATIFRRPLSLVKKALETFVSFGMVEIVDNVYTIPNWGKHQSLDRIEERNEYMKKYMREYRAKQKGIVNNENTDETDDNACKVNSKVNVSVVEEEREEEKKESKKKETASRFTPPTIEEVRAYCEERGNNVSPERFIDYYSSIGWKVGKNSMKDWKAAVRTWERKDTQPQAQGKTPQKTVLIWQGD